MSKKHTLAAALHEASGKKIEAAMLTKQDEVMSAKITVKPPSRIGKKVVAGYFDQAVVRQLKMLAVNNDSSIQVLLAEALNDLFEKYNRRPIA